jgi:hypothetical protein
MSTRTPARSSGGDSSTIRSSTTWTSAIMSREALRVEGVDVAVHDPR